VYPKTIFVLTTVLTAISTTDVLAQPKVHFPASPTGTTVAAPPTTFAPAQSVPPATSRPAVPYTAPTPAAPYAAPTPGTPYAAPTPGTPYSAPIPTTQVGPPPTFDPYARPSVTTAPAAVPYHQAPMATAPASPWQNYGAPPQQAGIYPNGVPYSWQQGSYGLQGQNGYLVSAQKAMQDIGFEHTYVQGKQSPNQLGIDRSEIYATFGVPLSYTTDSPLLITPGFAINWLNGPLSAPVDVLDIPSAEAQELPPRLYDAYLDFAWFPQFTPQLGAELGFRTGVWSDFSKVNKQSIRLLGRALAKVSASPTLDVLFGVVYLDRNHIKMLPAGGAYWRPTPEWDAYLVFPNPKVRKRFSNYANTEWYWYVAGEYGGGAWTASVNADYVSSTLPPEPAVQETWTTPIDINDLRVLGGIEWETSSQVRGHFEAGYVWDREVLYVNRGPGGLNMNFNPKPTFMLRGGLIF
jgi:hypothetical protein